MGHARIPHARVSAECGQATPPLVGATTARVRCCEPPLHDTVQVAQAPNGAATLQSVAQPAVLQARVSA
jgi:hypothetical protein